jgi:hypothetical protein
MLIHSAIGAHEADGKATENSGDDAGADPAYQPQARDNEQLLTARNDRVRMDGDYYVVDTASHRGCNNSNVDHEALARELRVLKSWEEVR